MQAIRRPIFTWDIFLSIVVKRCIIQTILISHPVYVMQALVIPDHVLTEINRLMFRYLWRKKQKTNCNRKAFEKVKENSNL